MTRQHDPRTRLNAGRSTNTADFESFIRSGGKTPRLVVNVHKALVAEPSETSKLGEAWMRSGHVDTDAYEAEQEAARTVTIPRSLAEQLFGPELAKLVKPAPAATDTAEGGETAPPTADSGSETAPPRSPDLRQGARGAAGTSGGDLNEAFREWGRQANDRGRATLQ